MPSSEEHTDGAPQFRELPGVWKRAMVDKWSSLTWFGKLFYPFWFLISAFLWLVLLTVVATAQAWMALNNILDRVAKWIAQKLPNTHKNE